MKMSSQIVVKVILVSIALGAAAVALAVPASASHVEAEITTEGPAALQVKLRSADQGLPIANAAVTLSADESFGGVAGRVELGQASTDQNGVATVRFHRLSAGDHQVRIEYVAPSETEPEVATAFVTMPGITSQVYRSSAGVHIPGLNVSLLIALVATVWAILLSVALRVIAIARAGADAGAPSPQPPRGRRADKSISRAGATGGR